MTYLRIYNNITVVMLLHTIGLVQEKLHSGLFIMYLNGASDDLYHKIT